MNSPIIFNKAVTTPTAIQETARRYVGVNYSRWHSRIVENAEGRPVGSVDCLRLFLYIFRDLGYLSPDFDPMALRLHPKEEVEAAIRSVLRENMTQVRKEPRCKCSKKPLTHVGDLLWLKTGHMNRENHFALLTETKPLPYGMMLHASSDDGKVIEQGLMPHNWQRIESVWRLRGIQE